MTERSSKEQSTDELVQRLQAGNARFKQGETSSVQVTPALLQELRTGQRPFAVILGCSDSRVPAEIIFDQSLGDLFVIRVAGNVVAPSQIGSVEYAVEQFGVKLVVVMGHSNCGAVEATLQELKQPSENRLANLRSIVDRIRPAVEPLVEANADAELLLGKAVRANIRASVSQLIRGSASIERLVESNRLRVVGAHYMLGTGDVNFYPES